MKEHKVVFDVNIWISYFIKNRTNELVDFIQNNNLTVYSDKYLIEEFNDVIHRKKFEKYLVEITINDCLNFIDILTISFDTIKKFKGSPDIKDDYLFDLALQTNSKILVTGDKKLLDFKTENIEILSLKNFKYYLDLFS